MTPLVENTIIFFFNPSLTDQFTSKMLKWKIFENQKKNLSILFYNLNWFVDIRWLWPNWISLHCCKILEFILEHSRPYNMFKFYRQSNYPGYFTCQRLWGVEAKTGSQMVVPVVICIRQEIFTVRLFKDFLYCLL